MGPQRVLQAVAVIAVAAASVPAAAQRLRERIAVIDLGPDSGGAVQRTLQTAVVTAGLDPVVDDGVEEALAGRDAGRDAVPLAAAIANAQQAFGELRCGDVAGAAQQAIGIAAARQAAGLAAPELVRAWTLLLLCADRENQLDAAFRAASQLRALGGSPDVPASVWAKYPEVDALANAELIELEVETEVPGAAIWIDFRQVGVSPLRIALPAGQHVLAAAGGGKRGWAAGRAVRTQKSVRIAMYDAAGSWSDVAQRVASWSGKPPPADQLAWLLARVNARIALVRHGDTVEVWGQVGRAEPPRRLGLDADEGIAPLADVARLLGLAAERVRAWNSRAPDPDRPLLVEQREPRTGRTGERPTKWWIYAAVLGAAALGGVFIIAEDRATDHQRVELSVP
jgi:hypothetical protein